MLSFPYATVVLSLLTLSKCVIAATECPSTWTCLPTDTAPVLDADLSEWSETPGFSSSLVGALTAGLYMEGEVAVHKCMYDADRIYFALEIPGIYRFNATDNTQCAAIATMMKIGSEATFTNMGGCPDAISGCANGVPDTCDPYRVDIGAHWELAGTEQGVTYPFDLNGNTGNDLVANKDDEYGVSSFCRADDDDADAANEWAGSWLHTNPTIGEDGNYIFEISRLLQTASSETDAQMAAGETYSFGVAYWDPFETEDGWSDAGHFVTGCGSNWVDLELFKASTSGGPALGFGLAGLAAVALVLPLIGGW